MIQFCGETKGTHIKMAIVLNIVEVEYWEIIGVIWDGDYKPSRLLYQGLDTSVVLCGWEMVSYQCVERPIGWNPGNFYSLLQRLVNEWSGGGEALIGNGIVL